MKVLAIAKKSGKKERDFLDHFDDYQISLGTVQDVPKDTVRAFVSEFDAVIILTRHKKRATVKAIQALLSP
jgi:hypothetical protein